MSTKLVLEIWSHDTGQWIPVVIDQKIDVQYGESLGCQSSSING